MKTKKHYIIAGDSKIVYCDICDNIKVLGVLTDLIISFDNKRYNTKFDDAKEICFECLKKHFIEIKP
jgi:hypothetical protein